jgi:hypothetical protein
LKGVRAEKASAWTEHPSTWWEMPTLPEGAKVIVDPENLVEKRDTAVDPR